MAEEKVAYWLRWASSASTSTRGLFESTAIAVTPSSGRNFWISVNTTRSLPPRSFFSSFALFARSPFLFDVTPVRTKLAWICASRSSRSVTTTKDQSPGTRRSTFRTRKAIE